MRDRTHVTAPALPVRIRSVGSFLPRRVVTAGELDVQWGLPAGTVLGRSGVATRHFVTDETASQMGAAAAREALERGGLSLGDLDAVVCASGTFEQPVPCTAALVLRELGGAGMGLAAFDVDATCLSFLVALDLVSALLAVGRYRRVLVVSTEIASCGLNRDEIESAAILGDGAAACVLERSASSALLAARIATYPEGAHLTEVRGGGSRLPGKRWTPETDAAYHFHMDGPRVFRAAAARLPDFLHDVLRDAGRTLDDVRLLIPHQASPLALRHFRRRLEIPEDRFLDMSSEVGNTIAASIPLALCRALETGRLQRGDTLLLAGTGAGLSLGAAVLIY